MAKLPLEGIRVAAITVVWAGPHVTQLLAEWGAEVIRVEPINSVQRNSRGAENRMTREQAIAAAVIGGAGAPSWPDYEPGDDPWNRSAAFNSHSRNKRSMTCDVMSPEGREAFLKLIEVCDVFIENNVPETIEKAGLTWEALREVNPQLIMLRMPAFGLDGPYKNYRGFGTHVEGMIGHHYLRGYRDADPSYTGDAFTADGIAGVLGALAVTMGLRHRRRTGEGQQIEMPLAQAFLPVLGEFILDYTMNGRVTPPQGNTHPSHAPHGVYPCIGDDQWIAIDVATDEQFAALCETLDATALASDERFAGTEARWLNRDALDAALGAFTAPREKEQLFHELQAVGVPAAPTHDELEALADEHLNARGFFQEATIEGIGTHRYPGMTIEMANTPNEIRLPPPKLGEHNEYVYLDLLGYSRDEYESLIERGLVGTRYTPEALGEG
jgi:crotonobetainyl-CoA:carnitine CoA-transferase CaiB-like acyl-CoA transferase